jgi:lipoprotein-anchoring transpeptidase ErfK/SrfK
VLERSIPVTDYYGILSRAAASLDPNTARARATLFDRARKMMLDRIRANDSRWSESEIAAESDAFEAAVSRIERERAQWSVDSPSRAEGLGGGRGRAPLGPAPLHDEAAPAPKRGRLALWGLAGAAAVLLLAGAAYMMSGPRSTGAPPPVASEPKASSKTASKATAPEPTAAGSKRVAGMTIDENELAPGVDGGSTDAGLPYFFRRQAVYYRTVYSPGMIVVDRSQRFLYFVEPQVRALRYGIGVGGECAGGAGLHRIARRAEWPEWEPSPQLRKARSYPEHIAGGPGNPLGARVLYFENAIGIHGTNAPKSIGQALTLGCFRMTNDDIVDLDKRVAIGAGVVVMN